MIKREGYPAEAHMVTTSDGYILELHRIPGGVGSVPVLLQHGLLSSSADWVVTGKGKGLGTPKIPFVYDEFIAKKIRGRVV